MIFNCKTPFFLFFPIVIEIAKNDTGYLAWMRIQSVWIFRSRHIREKSILFPANYIGRNTSLTLIFSLFTVVATCRRTLISVSIQDELTHFFFAGFFLLAAFFPFFCFPFRPAFFWLLSGFFSCYLDFFFSFSSHLTARTCTTMERYRRSFPACPNLFVVYLMLLSF